MKKIYKAHILYTKEQSRFEVLENGYVAVDADGLVTGVASDLASLDCQDAEVIDFGDCLLIPAMNDLHVHAPQYRNQGIAMDLELLPWLQNYTFPEEMRYASLDYAGRMYRRFVRDLWRFGTMRACVFATIHTESTRLLMQLFQESGMGALVGKVAMNRNCPEGLSESVEDSIQGYESLISWQSNLTPPSSLLPPRVRPIVTPRFIPSCSPEMLRACGQLAAKYQLPVQSHLSENKDEIALVKTLEPDSTCYGDAYDRYGLFGQTPTVMAHCVWTDGEELELMKRRGVMVAHCPTSNFKLQRGFRHGPRPSFPRRRAARRSRQRHQRRPRPEHLPHDGLCYSGEQDALSAESRAAVPQPVRGFLDCHEVGGQFLRPRGKLRTRV